MRARTTLPTFLQDEFGIGRANIFSRAHGLVEATGWWKVKIVAMCSAERFKDLSSVVLHAKRSDLMSRAAHFEILVQSFHTLVDAGPGVTKCTNDLRSAS